jgi:hypothetical protein
MLINRQVMGETENGEKGDDDDVDEGAAKLRTSD